MARFDGGWIKLHRKLLNEDWSALLDVVAKGLFFELLLMANYKSSRYLESGVVQTLNRGQVLTSIVELSAKAKMERPAVKKRLDLLVKTGTITYKSNNHGTIITIVNYCKYQTDDTAHDTAHDTAPNTAHDTHSEEVKNSKKVKKEKKVITIPSLALGSEWLNLGQSWLDFALKEMPWQVKQTNWSADSFGRELERIGKVMGIQPSGLSEILQKVRTDDFWRLNAASPFGLLKKSHKSGLRKIDNIIVRMKTKSDREAQGLADLVNSGYTGENFIPF